MVPCRPLLSLALIIFSGQLSYAQNSEFLPEIDVHRKLKASIRLLGQSSNTREGSDPTQVAIGPSLEIYLKPLLHLNEVAAFALDDAKTRPLVFSGGYRYLASPERTSTHRMLLTATSHLPLKLGMLLSDRNRADLDWSNNTFKWRYRNKLTIEKVTHFRSYHPASYVSAEAYYEEQVHKWAITELNVGCQFPVGRRFEIDSYYKHQNNTSKSPNSQLHGVGLKLNIYLSVK